MKIASLVTTLTILFFISIFAVEGATVLDFFWTNSQNANLGQTITITKGEAVEFFVWATTTKQPMDIDIRMYDSTKTKQIYVYEDHKIINTQDYSKEYFVTSQQYNKEGTYLIQTIVKADNGRELRSETITLIVKPSTPEPPINHPPVLAPIGNKMVNEGSNIRFTISATDQDQDLLSFSITNKPTNAVFTDNRDNTATFSWTPSYTQSGIYYITFTVSDNKNGLDSETIMFTAQDTALETDPGYPIPPYDPYPYHSQTNVITNPILTWKAGTTPGLTFDVYFGTDITPDSTELVSTGQTSKSYNPGRLIHNTNYYWQVVAIDRDGDRTSGPVWRFTTTNNVPPLNHPPVLAPIGNKMVNEGSNIRFTISATDQDQDLLSFSITNKPTNAVFTDNRDNTATFSWTPSYTQSGIYYITFTVSDNKNGLDSETIMFTVNNVQEIDNNAPVIKPISDQIIELGERFAYQVVATDKDNDPLRYRLFDSTHTYNGNNPFYINPLTGYISFTTNADMLGKTLLTVEVSDGNGGISQETFYLIVVEDEHFVDDEDDDEDEDEREDNIVTNIRNTACVDDNNRDKLGIYKQIIEVINLDTGRVISSETKTYECKLNLGTQITITGETSSDNKDKGINWLLVIVIALAMALLGLTIALLFPSNKRGSRSSSYRTIRKDYGPTTGYANDNLKTSIPKSYY